MSEPQINVEERAAIVREYKRVAAEPGPANYSPAGCLLLVLSLLGFVFTPSVLRMTDLPVPGGALLVGWGILALVGIMLSMFGGSLSTSRVGYRAQENLRWLSEHPAGGRSEERRREAVSLLVHAYHSGGPWTVTTYEFDEARRTLGEALPYVMAVERVLREELDIYAVFTDDESETEG